MSVTAITALPLEVLTRILEFADGQGDRARAARVCRVFRQAVCDMQGRSLKAVIEYYDNQKACGLDIGRPYYDFQQPPIYNFHTLARQFLSYKGRKAPRPQTIPQTLAEFRLIEPTKADVAGRRAVANLLASIYN